MSRDKNIDLIKCIACIGVVGLHTFQKDGVLGYHLLYVICGISIPFFFMCTGYLLMPEQRDNEYYFRKMKALLRVYITWSIPIAALSIVAKTILGNYGFVNLTDAIYDFVINGFGGFIQKGYCWHLWYIAAMIIEYIVIAAITSLQKKISAKEEHIVIICLVICIIVAFGVQISSYILRYPIQQNIIQTFRLWTWSNYILIGMIIRHKREVLINKCQADKHWWRMIIVIGGCILVWLYQMCIADVIIHTRFAEYLYDDPITICFNVLLFSVLLGVKVDDKLGSAIDLFAPLTLGIYLIHGCCICKATLAADQ